MARIASPLRYPGGKARLYPLLSSILRINNLERKHYAEPFAGGGGLALTLLYEGHVSDIHINDIDPSIWAFWHSALNDTHELVSMIARTPVTIDEWRRQREILMAQDAEDSLALGFAAFFLNRTNRSGIIKDAGVIGGIKQTGQYKIDCRFNREDLVRRIRRIAKYRSRIHLSRHDALSFIKDICVQLSASVFFCVDPPYFNKGPTLYTSFYNPANHSDLATTLLNIDNPWVVTYDNDPAITALYRDRRQFEFDVNYSLETKRLGTELMIAAKGLRLPRALRDRQVNRPQYRAACQPDRLRQHTFS